MSYIGNTPADKFQTLQKQSFTTSATDTYTLSYAVTNPQDLALFINNVRQNPNDAYTVSNTTLTLSSAITSSDTMYAVFLGRAVETIAPATGSVTNAMLAGSIANAKLSGPLGKIGQVLHTETTTQVGTTSSSYSQYTQLNRTITPSSTSSKILVQVSLSFFLLGSNYNDAGFQITQGGTSIANYGFAGYKPDSTSALAFSPVFLQTLHSPSSTSELTYGVKYNQPQGSETLIITYQGGSTGEQQRSSITVMEVLA